MKIEGVPRFASDERPYQYLKLSREGKTFVSLVESVISFPQKLHIQDILHDDIIIFYEILYELIIITNLACLDAFKSVNKDNRNICKV